MGVIMTHQMNLNLDPFNRIQMGTKIIELRLYDEKRKSLKIGDVVIFTNAQNDNEKIRTKVINLFRFDSFEDLYNQIPHSMIGYDNDFDGHPDDMLEYYDNEKQNQHGVLGIQIKVIDRLTVTDIHDIEEKLGYVFKNKNILVQAFTRTSFANNKDIPHSEILEYIGDSVLGFVITKMISDYKLRNRDEGVTTDYSEGDLSQLRSLLVENKNLEANMNQFDFIKYLLVGDNDSISDSYKSDLVESIIGAVALDSNYDQEELYEIVDYFVSPRIYFNSIDFKNYLELKKWFKLRNMKSIIPTVIEHKNDGYSEYETKLEFDSYKIEAIADTKIDSLFKASRIALEEIEKNNEHISVKDFLKGLNENNAKTYLDKLKKLGFYHDLLIGEEILEDGKYKVLYDIGYFSNWYVDRNKKKAHKICALICINSLIERIFKVDSDIKILLDKLGYEYYK